MIGIQNLETCRKSQKINLPNHDLHFLKPSIKTQKQTGRELPARTFNFTNLTDCKKLICLIMHDLHFLKPSIKLKNRLAGKYQFFPQFCVAISDAEFFYLHIILKQKGFLSDLKAAIYHSQILGNTLQENEIFRSIKL